MYIICINIPSTHTSRLLNRFLPFFFLSFFFSPPSLCLLIPTSFPHSSHIVSFPFHYYRFIYLSCRYLLFLFQSLIVWLSIISFHSAIFPLSFAKLQPLQPQNASKSYTLEKFFSPPHPFLIRHSSFPPHRPRPTGLPRPHPASAARIYCHFPFMSCCRLPELSLYNYSDFFVFLIFITIFALRN